MHDQAGRHAGELVDKETGRRKGESGDGKAD